MYKLCLQYQYIPLPTQKMSILDNLLLHVYFETKLGYISRDNMIAIFLSTFSIFALRHKN